MSKRSTDNGDGYIGGSRTAAVRFMKELPRRMRRQEFPGQIVIIDLLEQIDHLREREGILVQNFNSMLETGYPGPDRACYSITEEELPNLQRAWADFSVQGGVTANDFKAFIRGERIGTGNVIRRGHLRLVHSRKRLGGKVARGIGCAAILAITTPTPRKNKPPKLHPSTRPEQYSNAKITLPRTP